MLNKDIEQILANAKASMSFSNFNINDEMVELARKLLKGELTETEVLDIIKNKVN